MCLHFFRRASFLLFGEHSRQTHSHTPLWTEFWETREELIDPSFSYHHTSRKKIIGYQREKKWLPKV